MIQSVFYLGFIGLTLTISGLVSCINLKSQPQTQHDIIDEKKMKEIKDNIETLSIANNNTYYTLFFNSPLSHPSIKYSFQTFAKEFNSLYPNIIDMIYETTKMHDSCHLFHNGKEIFNKELNRIDLSIFSDIVNKIPIIKFDSNETKFQYFVEKYSIHALNINKPFPNVFIQQSSHKKNNLTNILYSNNGLYSNDKRFSRLLIALVLVTIFSLLVFILFTKSVKWAESSQMHLNRKRDICIMEMISNKAILS